MQTEDGSSSIYIPELNEHYHSTHGAVVEAKHVYIDAGYNYSGANPCYILEAGFGTGLNALLTLEECMRSNRSVVYHSFEKYPLSADEYANLNYGECVSSQYGAYFKALHAAPWNEDVEICPGFILHKHRADFYDVNFQELFDVVYYDAFNPDVQPHLWSKELLQRFYNALKPGGVLTTYCVKGIVKQAMRDCGFTIKRLPGPPGKHQMLRAIR
ncbi:MAG: tRNA (5-methylaminomethyl-2-thiouridine)(34)-methyltransferase MnmD [Marinifilaceae bacterium]